MKIALLDLNHTTIGVHTNTVPLGIGLIAKYLKSNIDNPDKYDIKLFKAHEKLIDTLSNWIPDVVGITQYSWNSQLNNFMAKYILELNPDCVVIAGGPNLHTNKDKEKEFLEEYDFIDICVPYEGEIPFLNIIKALSEGKTINKIESARINNLDVFGSVYADGLFDELLDDGFHPFLQTQRGCPNRCSYCHTSDKYYSKIIFQSPEVFRKDMEYLGKKYKDNHEVTLYLANTNFGLYERDFEIASIIRDIQNKYNWPKKIDCNYGSDSKKLLRMHNMWKYKMLPAIALQTLTADVLSNINRRNIDFDEFIDFHDKVTDEYGDETWTELILCLPGETRESFIETLRKILNSKVQKLCIYTLMLLNGTPLEDDEMIKKYGMEIKHRIVPRCFTEINGNRVFDTERVVVATNTMSYDDYLFFRKLALLTEVFLSSDKAFKYRVKMIDRGEDIMNYLMHMYNNLNSYPELSWAVDDFMMETENELFNTREELIEFFNKDENYVKLLNGELGDNLLRKHKEIILKHEM